jgi:HAD superfamily phosphoserine phosphatase-like hydrolase
MNFVFDFDSTLLSIESLDFVISKVSNGKFDKQIEEITNLGMNGKASLQETITRRLELCKITQQHLEAFARQMVQYLTVGMAEVIHKLQEKHSVYIVSGGLMQLIAPIAKALCIPETNCMANKITFHSNGTFELDKTSPLLYKNGKSQALETFGILNSNTVMIGDGYTDLEVHLNNLAVHFIGFGVNVMRDVVREKSPVFVTTMEEFLEAIDKIQSVI